MSGVSVVVVNFNTREDLARCLASVCAAGPEAVVVADNGSTDGSREMVEASFPRATLLRLDHNPGYGGAANRAIALTTAPAVLLLNSDTVLRPDTLAVLGAALDRHERAGVIGPRLLNLDGTLQPSTYPFPGTARWLVDNDEVGGVLGRVPGLRGWGLRTWAHDRERAVPWVKGAALAIRRTAFDAVGGFDPAYFMYHEESDLCYRLGAAGWETWFTPATEVVHTGGASTAQVPVDMAVSLHRAASRFHQTHYAGLRLRAIEAVWQGIARARLGLARFGAARARTEAERAEAALRVEAAAAVLAGDDR